MNNFLFNTPFEFSLRILMILDISDVGLTFDRIAFYDFIAIHCNNFDFIYKSLNGETDFAFSELSARRNLTKSAIKDLVIDGLVIVTNDKTGILYSVSKTGRKMSKNFQSDYAMKYKRLLHIIIEKYRNYSDIELSAEINIQSTKFLRR